LVDEELVGPCVVEQVTSFATGRPLAVDELDVAFAWHDRFVEGGRRLDGLLLEQISSEQFVTRRSVEVQP
jgi:hypothetical protein